jgi:hypothetical protein
MSPFEFVFGLFGLLLGLCIAEIFGGVGRAFEQRRQIRIGWLTPLLAILVLCDLTSYWGSLWEDRNVIPMNQVTLMLGALFAGIYYLAAYTVFPDQLQPNCNLDLHFFRVRQLVVGISSLAFFGVALVELTITHELRLKYFYVNAVIFVPTYAAALISRRKWVVGGALALLIAFNVAGAITHTVRPFAAQ